MASFVFDVCLEKMLGGQMNFAEDEFSVLLAASGYWPEKEADKTRLDVTHEVVGQGYKSGGLPVAVSISVENGESVIVLGGATWPQASINSRYAVYFRNGGSSQDDLVACIDFGGDVISSNAEFSLTASRMRIST